MIENAGNLYRKAKLLEENFKFKSPTSCYIMASKMVKFDIETINEKLLEEIEEIYSFFTKTYEGIYCSLCDAYNH